MKIFLDNEAPDFRKIVTIVSSYNKNIHDDLNTVVDALKAYGYDESNIRDAFIAKSVQWGDVTLIKSEGHDFDDFKYYEDDFKDYEDDDFLQGGDTQWPKFM